MNLTDILVHHSAHFGTEVALEYEGRETTWDELLERTRHVAGALQALGVGRGDVVAVLLHNSDRFLEVMHAVSHLGAVLMPLNWRLAGPELAYILDDSTAGVLLSEAEFADTLAGIRGDVGCRYVAATHPAPSGWTSLEDALATAAPVAHACEMQPADLLRLMYTSGTTSRPKGVMLTYGNLWAKCAAQIVEFRMTHDAVGLACGPLYHVGTLDMTTTNLMYLGARVHVQRRFDAAAVLAAIERHRVSHVWLAPAMVRALVDHPDVARRDLTSVRQIIDGGEKMPLPLIDRVLSTFPNAWFADAYGLTETMSGDTVLDKGRERRKLGSVGRPVLHTQVRVVDGEGRDVAPGERGEIVVRGPKTFAGYWRNQEATDAAFRDGWFHTGDLGVLDEDGYLFVVDRLKDVIVSGGENIASSEVERVLYEHPAVAEVAVVAGPHERWNEVPVAFVVATSAVEASELEAHCRARLAAFKVPKAFHLVDALPRNPSGKVLKRELRDRAHASARPA
jgi:acyl-CoA synthetase (AMP-forming)/AMP-acid ligase II